MSTTIVVFLKPADRTLRDTIKDIDQLLTEYNLRRKNWMIDNSSNTQTSRLLVQVIGDITQLRQDRVDLEFIAEQGFDIVH